tara:strand:- start:744 stop:1061 length:318 start_codon:yes stop_codon:yes gene_type:complete
MYKNRSNKNKTKKIEKSHPAKGWSKMSPNTKQRVKMFKKCGKKCFLGPNRSFPICAKNTCKINKKGIYSAYIRARQWSKLKKTYKRIANRAKRLIKNNNYIDLTV